MAISQSTTPALRLSPSALARMLREKTQRRLCRLLFVALCVLPTLAVGAVATQRILPGWRARTLQAVSDRLGVRVDCDRLLTPKPGLYELTNLQFGEFGVCDRVRLLLQGNRWTFDAGMLQLDKPTEAAAVLRSLVESGLLAEGQAQSVQLLGAQSPTTLSMVRCTLDGKSKLLKLADQSGLVASVHHGDAIRIETGQQRLNARWLPVTPIDADWAEELTFSGLIKTSSEGGAARGDYDASQITLRGLRGQKATLQNAQVCWRGEQVESFQADLKIEQGELSQQLAYGLAARLLRATDAFLSAWNVTPRPTAVPFSTLACRVELQREGLLMNSTDAVVEQDGVALLLPPQGLVSPSRLVQAWFPDDPAELPSTAAAVEMARRLPGASSR